jgi:hypothetical protein
MMQELSSKAVAPTEHSALFVLNVWEERRGGGHVEWRGELLHVDSGLTLRFEDWPELVDLIAGAIHAGDDRQMVDDRLRAAQSLS